MEDKTIENTKEVPIWIGITGLVLIIAAIISDCVELKALIEADLTLGGSLDYVCTMLSLMFAALYFMMGFKKDAAVYFRLFIWMFAIENWVLVIMMRTRPIIFMILGLLNYGVLCVLAVAKDLGKKKSLLLCVLNMIVAAVAIFLFGFVFGTGGLGNMLSKLLLAVLLFVMANAKYADKEIRGTK